jgi:Xaa-Pro aminopeptidase
VVSFVVGIFVRCIIQIAAGRSHTEITVADQLERFRSRQPNFVGLSFETIAGFGPHGAIIHYKATSETAITIDDSNLLLIDSGAQARR